MDTVITVIQVLLGGGGVLALVRAVRGPNLIDRIVALDLVLLLLAGGIAAHGGRSGSELYVAVLIAVALVVFASTVLVAQFIEWRDGP